MTRLEKSTILELSSKTNRYLLAHFIGLSLTVILTIISTIMRYDELMTLSILSLLILSQTLFVGFEYFEKLEREYNIYGNKKGYIEIHNDYIILYDSEVFRKPIAFNGGLETQANWQLLSNCQTNELQSLVVDRIEKGRYKFAKVYFDDILNTFIKESSKKQIKNVI